jgi:thiamine-phosphate pyrophosphorylase
VYKDRVTLANLARQLNSRSRYHDRNLPPLILVTDGDRLPDPISAAARLPAGSGILLRHYGRPDRIELARRLAAVARKKRLILLVAGDWRLAAAVGADGVHLPESLARSGRLAPLSAWARRRGRLVTAACHDRRALAAATNLDAIFLSPVFATASHPGAPVLGALGFARLARASPAPVYALGGVTATTARHIRFAVGLAAIGAFDAGQ